MWVFVQFACTRSIIGLLSGVKGCECFDVAGCWTSRLLAARRHRDDNRSNYFLLKKLKGSSTRKNRALTKPLSSSYPWLRHGYLLNIFIEFSLNPIREFWSKQHFNLRDEK